MRKIYEDSQMTKKQLIFGMIFMLFLSVSISSLKAQGQIYRGANDPAGDIAAEREGYMTGNRVFLYFRNTTELSDWPKAEVSRWPNNYEGVKMTDGIGLLVGAVVYLKNDTVPVTDPTEIAVRKDLEELYFLQTSYREMMDRNPTGTVEWGFYPVFGYFNEGQEYPAMSNDPQTYPVSGWPFRGSETHWSGNWDGRYGQGQIRADLETYFVANDAHDQEYLGPEDKAKYYPRPGRFIGDIRPDVTIQAGLPWGGLGLRVEQRGYQWNNPQARDAIFWEYTISNISDYDLPKVAFGYWVDNAIGHDADDELGFFDKKIDLAYSWDINGVGRGGLKTGTMGFAYLESPGLAYDGIDNDEDGLIDEQRDNIAVTKVGPTAGINDLNLFLDTYKLKAEDLKEHWDADEDQDWMDGIDDNGDGIYQTSEFAGDDIGLDGIGPGEINYTGPDIDGSECNHKPDFIEGQGCEPNFAFTDVTESDMVGLTSFMLFPVQPKVPPYTKWFRNDRSMWDIIGQDTLVEYLGNISNLIETFASGPFPLYQGRSERISMSELHSYDPLEGLNSATHSAPALYEQKRIVQVIYEKDYQFAKPPLMPKLTATAGDGKVILTWDNRADTQTKDAFLKNKNDFEGYKIFRATDKKMSDAEVITDGYGTPMFKKPVFQCDLIDGIRGFTNFGMVNGVGYNLGHDSGLVHHFIDTNVQNGRTYYYAIVAYDYGAPDIAPGIAPSENNVIIDLDEAENVKGIGRNVQIVVPHQKAAGFIPPSVELVDSLTNGTGTISLEILAEGSLKYDHEYVVKFGVDTLEKASHYQHGYKYINNSMKIYDVTADNTQVYADVPESFAFSNLVFDDAGGYWVINTDSEISTDIFDGLRMTLSGQVKKAVWNNKESGWLVGKSPIFVQPSVSESKFFPWDYDIVFTETPSYKGRISPQAIKNEAGKRISRNDLLTGQHFNFYVINKTFKDADGNYELLDLIVHDLDKNGEFDMLKDRVFCGPVNSKGWWAGTAFLIDFRGVGSAEKLPSPGDVYRVRYSRPFTADDGFSFIIRKGEGLDKVALKESMKDIKVVPNPYVATNAMETAVGNPLLNQRRSLMFIHIPAQCSIKIFTVSGILVDEIDVNNANDDGIVHWNLQTMEGLEVAAGMYVYQVKSSETGDEKFGKFAIIK